MVGSWHCVSEFYLACVAQKIGLDHFSISCKKGIKAINVSKPEVAALYLVTLFPVRSVTNFITISLNGTFCNYALSCCKLLNKFRSSSPRICILLDNSLSRIWTPNIFQLHGLFLGFFIMLSILLYISLLRFSAYDNFYLFLFYFKYGRAVMMFSHSVLRGLKIKYRWKSQLHGSL